EISTVDHALFVAGALVAGEYYKGTEVEQLARQLYSNTDWNWLYNGTFLYQGWTEDSTGTFEGGRTLDVWNRYSELMILLFLAMGSSDTSMSIPPSAWDNLTYGTGRMFPFEYAHLFPGDAPQNFAFVPNMPNTIQESGYSNSASEFHYLHAGSLHNHQYSHLFADFRSRRDRYQTDYFANSISATLANRQYCINLNSHAFGGDPASPDQYLRQPYETYGPDCWGIMAGVPSFTGYAVMQPIVMSYDNFSPENIAGNNDSGTVLLSAPLGSTECTPRQTIDYTRNMLTRFQNNEGGYNDLIGRYGFMNSFNLGRPLKSSQVGHFAAGIIGLDMGPVIGSVENFMGGLVWKMAMRNQFIQRGMQNAGFGTGAVEPFVLNFDDNPPLPNDDPNGGGEDPNSFGGSSYQFGSGAIGYAWIDDPFPELPYGPQSWAQQISTVDNSDSGAFITLSNHSVSRYDRVSFWVKGDTGTEEYSVGLKDSVLDRLGNPLQAIEAKLPISRYHPDGHITSQWREVRIPLRDFADKGVRLTALDNISFTNTSPDGGTIYVDDIAFLGDEFKPAAPGGLLETISGNSVTLSWDANPEADVVGYRVYRSDDQGATFNLLNTSLVVPAAYTDVNPPGRQHLYRITAVDNADPANESDPSETVSVSINQPPVVGDIVPSSGASRVNKANNFSTTYTDGDGWQDIQYANFLINTSTGGSKCFYGYYDQNTKKLYLRNDANTAWMGGYAPGTHKVIENSYAKLNCASTAISGSSNTLTVKWNITFKSTFTGTKNMYLYVKDDQGAYSGWVLKGTWAIKR
ncbi:MAG: glucoamylase family protein, partial [Candidatus Omnitrophota bacterium]|nr:glucoamylase family protein [Candidatus Omnitrophota bacterium]